MGRVLGGIRLSDVLRPENGLIQLYREPHSSSPFPSAFSSSISALGYAAGGGTGIWLSVPIGWALADAIGIGYYLKTKTA